ncbi:MAG TPA: sigma-70 family RNA polymerase sigma factor, partial [Actinomycetota bacterium]|nr:sigma-70 family RNA polymerase sigma factor [Actinomycetota bacterium]
AYGELLLRYFVAWIGDRPAAEELTGRVFAAAVERLPRFDGSTATLGSWLFGIARHELGGDAPGEPLGGHAPGPAPGAAERHGPGEAARMRYSHTVAAARQLAADQREVVLLRMIGLTAAETAQVVGTTAASVKTLQRRGLAGLARLLGLPGPGG